jgi:hypothetical protein
MRAAQVETARAIPREMNAGKVRGYRLAEQNAAREKAEAEAEEIVAVMADKLNIQEDEHAKAALEFAVSVVKDETVNVKDRLSGAKLVLDFTKSKPASKAEVEIKKAEDFLDAIAKDDDTEAS